MDQTRKNLIKIFRECGLFIVCEISLIIVDFWDVCFDMKQETYTPYRKPNNDPTYINKHSNHPQSVIRDLPKFTSKRISDTWSNEETFNNHIPIYQQTLKNSGFNNNLIYRQSEHGNSHIQEKQIHRKRKIIWFNPPFSTNVKTNIKKFFFKLSRKQFPKTNKLHRILSKNTVKISYSSMRNTGSIISAHKQRLLTPNNTSFGCNCRNKSNYPAIIYQADLTNDVDYEYKLYYGLTEWLPKERFRNHTKSFNHRWYQNETEFSKYIWTLKHQNKTPTVKWKIVQVVNSKVKLIPSLLNKGSEFVNNCQHKHKLLFKFMKVFTGVLVGILFSFSFCFLENK